MFHHFPVISPPTYLGCLGTMPWARSASWQTSLAVRIGAGQWTNTWGAAVVGWRPGGNLWWLINWLVISNMNFPFRNIWDNPPHWLMVGGLEQPRAQHLPAGAAVPAERWEFVPRFRHGTDPGDLSGLGHCGLCFLPWRSLASESSNWQPGQVQWTVERGLWLSDTDWCGGGATVPGSCHYTSGASTMVLHPAVPSWANLFKQIDACRGQSVEVSYHQTQRANFLQAQLQSQTQQLYGQIETQNHSIQAVLVTWPSHIRGLLSNRPREEGEWWGGREPSGWCSVRTAPLLVYWPMVALVPDFVLLTLGFASALSREKVWSSAKKRWLCFLCSTVFSGSGWPFTRVLWMPFVTPILSWMLPTLWASKAMLVMLLQTCSGSCGPCVKHTLVPGSCSLSPPVCVLYSRRSVKLVALPILTLCLSTVGHRATWYVCMPAAWRYRFMDGWRTLTGGVFN